ncbi:hypothetical protein K2173_027929 [Erythroxylum novogranatense]|uniref:Peptidase C1A papain C-terminal domain-containing protein n=1 Tax=Erythroxylum novogranatense TaxID=1862640 RepID=A0AAV8U0E7_9ROSI|nr:hypothetical protein K2173_027929 [Erythroxylum novogranatense]
MEHTTLAPLSCLISGLASVESIVSWKKLRIAGGARLRIRRVQRLTSAMFSSTRIRRSSCWFFNATDALEGTWKICDICNAIHKNMVHVAMIAMAGQRVLPSNILSRLDSSRVVVFLPDSLILAAVNLTGTEYLHLYPTSASSPWIKDKIAANLMENGPLAVSYPYVTSKRQDHGVLLVRCGSAPISFNERIIKSSWGEKWGEKRIGDAISAELTAWSHLLRFREVSFFFFLKRISQLARASLYLVSFIR